MNKLIVALMLVMAAALTVTAQNTLVNNPDNKAYFGIRAGGEVTCPGKISIDGVGIDILRNGGGAELGAIYNIPLVANLYVEPGVKLFYNTYSLEKNLLGYIQDDIIFDGLTLKKFGLRIPVMAGYHLDFTDDIKVSLFTGPVLEVGLAANGYIKGKNIDLSHSLYGAEGGLNRVDLLWGLGAGISYQQLYFGVNGGIGMLNMLRDSDWTFHENVVTFSVGYNF